MSSPTSTAPLSLDTFLPDRRALSRDAFLRKYPNPMLVIPLSSGEPLEDDGAFRTQVLANAAPKNPIALAARQTLVVPVEKRSGDAFLAFIWVGRESRCDVALPFESVSKLQAQFVRRPTGELDLLDAGSTNGTFVDGNRLEKNKPSLMRDDLKIRFGLVDARFRTSEGFYDELGRYL